MTEQKISTSLSAILAKHHEAKGEPVPAVLLPPPPPALSAPSAPWSPGDPLNQSQQLKLSTGATLFAVAMAADVPPDEDVAMSWPNRKARYADVIADLEAAKSLEAEARAKIKAESLPPPPPPAPEPPNREAVMTTLLKMSNAEIDASMGTPIGVPESGFVNAPESKGMPAFRTPEELRAYQDAQTAALGLEPPPPPAPEAPGAFEPYTDRDQAKKEAVRLGLVPENSQLRLPKLNEILSDYLLKGLSPEMTEQSKALAKKLSALPPPPPVPGAIAARAEKSVAPPASGYLLFVGAFPVKGFFGRVVHFSDIAAVALKNFQEKWQQPLPGFIDYKGNDYFAHEIEKELARYGAGDVIYVDPRGREASAALSRLEQHAAAVVKGGF